MIRFFTSPSLVSGGQIQLSAEDAAHIRSLRLRPSELFIVCDGEGTDYICKLGDKAKPEQGPAAEIVESRPSVGEPSVSCQVYIALMKGDRLDYAVQKSVELGASGVVLYPSERCIAAPRDMSSKTVRLRRIALETAKQCGRGRVPDVSLAASFKEAVERAARADLRLFFYESENDLHLKQALSGENLETGISVSLVTGPEGGFEPHEAAYVSSAGFTTVSLGPRILRCETAPVVALAAVMYHTGNL